jgi:hypothetical protein
MSVGASQTHFPVKSTTQIIEQGMIQEEYIVKGLVPRTGLGVLYGSSKSFKSFIAVDLSYHIACGWKWARRRVTGTPVFYVCAEGTGSIEKRISGFLSSHPQHPARIPFYLMKGAPDLGSPVGMSDDFDRLVSTIKATCGEPGVIVIDTLQQCLGGNDENGAGMVNFIRNAQELSRRFECFVLTIHHTGWSNGDRIRGHSSLHGAVDLQILSERLPGELAATLNVQKVKDGEADFRLTATLKKVVLGHDAEGDEISTLAVDQIEEGLSPKAERHAKAKATNDLPDNAKRTLSALKRVVKDQGAYTDEPGFPSGAVVIELDRWRDEAAKHEISGSDKPNAKRMAFIRSVERLRKAGIVSVMSDKAWIAA